MPRRPRDSAVFDNLIGYPVTQATEAKDRGRTIVDTSETGGRIVRLSPEKRPARQEGLFTLIALIAHVFLRTLNAKKAKSARNLARWSKMLKLINARI